MAGIGDLHALARLLLDSCAEALDTIPTYNAALLGAPSRKFVSPGLPVIEVNCCDQLTVYVQTVTHTALSEKVQLGAINHVAMIVQISRCIPSGFDQMGNYRPPSTAALDGASTQLDVDAWALWNHLFNLQSSGLLLSLCDEVSFDGISAIVPSGGCAGWTAQVRAQLDGYPETFST